MMKVPLAFLLSLTFLLPGSLAGQGWTLDVYGGRVAYDLASSTPSENGAILGVRYREPDVGWGYLSSGVPFSSDDVTWGAGGLGARLDRGLGSVDVGVDLGAHGYLYRDPVSSSVGRGGTLELRPLVGIENRRLRLEGRSGWVRHGSRIDEASFSRGVHDSDLSLEISLSPSAMLSGRVRHVRAEEDAYSFGGGRLTVGSSRASVWGSVGGWTSEVLSTVEWGAGASVRLDEAGRTALGLSVRQSATDPVYWNASRRQWRVGVSHKLGGGRSPSSADREVPALAGEVSAGSVTVRIPITDSGGAPSVAGDFTGWETVSMVQDGDHWSATFELEPGVYQYAFRSPSGEWYVPESVPGRRPDGMGGYVAILVVS